MQVSCSRSGHSSKRAGREAHSLGGMAGNRASLGRRDHICITCRQGPWRVNIAGETLNMRQFKSSDLNHLKIFLASTTLRTSPVHGYLCPGCSGFDAMLDRASGFVVNPAANQAHPSLGFGHVHGGHCHRMWRLYRAGYRLSGPCPTSDTQDLPMCVGNRPGFVARTTSLTPSCPTSPKPQTPSL